MAQYLAWVVILSGWSFSCCFTALLALADADFDNSAMVAFFSGTRIKTPSDCFDTNQLLEDLVVCLEEFTVHEGFYTSTTYAAAQPSPSERSAWVAAVDSLLTNGCDSLGPELKVPLSGHPSPLPAAVGVPGLGGNFQIRPVDDPQSGRRWCVMYQSDAVDGTQPKTRVFKRGWGTIITSSRRDHWTRSLHFSVPHPITDRGTGRQAAALLTRTNGTSLIIAGRNRQAYDVETPCAKGTPGGAVYYRTDGTHDKDEPFFLAMQQVMVWQNTSGGCPLASCAYIQIHGKGPSTCKPYTVFLSSGRGNSVSSAACYENPLLPVQRIKHELEKRSFVAGLPSTTERCALTATKNIFARLAQGVAFDDICRAGVVIPCATMGSFVHMEQDAFSRSDENWDVWASAINNAFPLQRNVY